MRSNSLGKVSEKKHNSLDINETTKPIVITKNVIPTWMSFIVSSMWIISIIVSGIVIWRVEHVHVHVAEIIAKVYECNGVPANETVCTVVAHL